MSKTISDLDPASLPLPASTLFECDVPGSPGGSRSVPLINGIYPNTSGQAHKALKAKLDGYIDWEFERFSERIHLGADITTNISAGTTKAYWRPPFDAVDVEVRASLVATSSGGDVVVDVNKNGVSMLGTKLTVFQGGLSSRAGSPTTPTYTSQAFVEDDLIEFDIDSAGTNAKGLVVTVTGTRAS